MDNKKLRVNSGITIEVNDDGDVIVARIDDVNFVEDFYNLLEGLEKVDEDIKKTSFDNDREKIRYVSEKTREIMEQIDNLFGEDTCRKVFGDIVPSSYAITDFFDQLLPIFTEYSDARQKKIAEKYNRSRKGERVQNKPHYYGKGKKR